MSEIRNAKIRSTQLGWEDHGIFTFGLNLEYGGMGQSFGGYCLDEPIKKDGKFMERVGTAVGMDAIMKILKVLEVSDWEKLPGTFVRADGDSGNIYRIGHLLKDEWFDAGQHFEKWGRFEK